MRSKHSKQQVTIPDEVAKFKYRDIAGIVIFVFTAGVVAGGYVDMKRDFEAFQIKVDDDFKDVRNTIDTKVEGVNQKVFNLAIEINKRKVTDEK